MYTIYCDGSTRINNQKGVDNIGGFGYVVYDNSGYIVDTYSEQVQNTTNNRMELMALYKVIEKYGTDSIFGANKVYTDSTYAMKCITEWGDIWNRNGWINSKKKPVENKDIIKPMYDLYWNNHFIVIEKCSGHSGIEGNELADKLASGLLTAEEVYYSDTKNKIPNQGYFIGNNNWESNSKYKDDPQYWITGIEDGWISPTQELMDWYAKYGK